MTLLRGASMTGEPRLLACRAPAAPGPAPAAATEAPPAEEDPVAVLRELRKQAFDDGYRDGLAAGGEEGRAQLAAQAEALRAAALAVREATERTLAAQEDALVEVAFAAACRLVGEAALTREGVRGAVCQALREVHARERLVLRVPPPAYRSLAEDAGFCASLRDEHGVELVADERLGEAGCVIESPGGTLDARLEVQLQQLAAALRAARAAEPAAP
jgi:flagellar assembly protein FliH